MHGIFYLYIQKFAGAVAATAPGAPFRKLQSRLESSGRCLPDENCPDADALGLLHAVSDSLGEPLDQTYGRFGEFVAPHLIKVAGPLIDPAWRTLDVVEHADDLIQFMVQDPERYSDRPIHHVVRISPSELHLVYYSKRQMCAVAAGIVRGVAAHFQERLTLTESVCMHRGGPFCSFLVRCLGRDSLTSGVKTGETICALAHNGSLVAASNGDPGVADDREPDALAPRISSYRVLRLIASGGMGRVYLAHDDQLDRPVAIKVMAASRARAPGARERFIREGRAVAVISHPHVITVHGVGEHDGRPYMVMQHLEGIPLSACLAPLPVGAALRIGRETASGLAAAHARGLVHRDIKPQNIFLEGPEQSVRIIDFGLARGLDDGDRSNTVDGLVMGTPAYMSPEQINDATLDFRSDLFGLGVVLYEILSGRRPFEGDSMVGVLTAISRGNPVPLGQIAPAAPPEVDNLVMRLLAHRREDRPPSAHAVELELRALEQRFAESDDARAHALARTQ